MVKQQIDSYSYSTTYANRSLSLSWEEKHLFIERRMSFRKGREREISTLFTTEKEVNSLELNFGFQSNFQAKILTFNGPRLATFWTAI